MIPISSAPSSSDIPDYNRLQQTLIHADWGKQPLWSARARAHLCILSLAVIHSCEHAHMPPLHEAILRQAKNGN